MPAAEEPTNADGESEQVSPIFPTPPYVHFQQTFIRERVKTMSVEEAAAVAQHIEDHYAAALKAWERPWMTMPKSSKLPEELTPSSTSSLSEEELEMGYYQK